MVTNSRHSARRRYFPVLFVICLVTCVHFFTFQGSEVAVQEERPQARSRKGRAAGVGTTHVPESATTSTTSSRTPLTSPPQPAPSPPWKRQQTWTGEVFSSLKNLELSDAASWARATWTLLTAVDPNDFSSSSVPSQRKSPDRCSDNTNCTLGQNCLADLDGRCYPSPTSLSSGWSLDPRPGPQRHPAKGGTANEELQCSWQKKVPDQLPPLPRNLSSSDPEAQFDTFKHLTGSYFEKWYDIPNSKIVRVDKTRGEEFQYGGGAHSGPGMVYKLENICVRPSGRLAAYKIKGLAGDRVLNPFQGGHDIFPFPYLPAIEKPEYTKSLNNYFTTHLEDLAEEPTWYVDHKLAFIPAMDKRDAHAGHSIVRMGALIANVDDAWPREH